MPQLRPGTSDWATWENINTHNEYRLPDDMRGQTIFDVGAHIGAFAFACMKRGARRVYCFEPDKGNLNLLSRNLRGYLDLGHVRTFPVALVGTGPKHAARLSKYAVLSHETNTGSPSITDGEGAIDVACKSLDSFTRLFKTPIDLLKLDCEGSEWLILPNSDLSPFQRIIGEYHEGPLYVREPPPIYKDYDLIKTLEMAGFDVETFRHGHTNLGMFFAERISNG